MTVTVFIVSLLAAMALGMPIAVALIVCGAAFMLQQGNFDSQIIAQNMISGADSFSLMAIPFFMLAGQFMEAAGTSKAHGPSSATVGAPLNEGPSHVAVIA